MFYLESYLSGESEQAAGLISDKNTNFFADIVFKYLFVIIISYGFSFLSVIMYKSYYFYDYYGLSNNLIIKILFKITKIYSSVILPIALVIDLLCRKRNRVVNPIIDSIVFISAALVLTSYDIFYYYRNATSKTNIILISTCSKLILFFLTYFIYDFYLFKVNKTPGSYSLCSDNNA
jgi:hypothetical protein